MDTTTHEFATCPLTHPHSGVCVERVTVHAPPAPDPFLDADMWGAFMSTVYYGAAVTTRLSIDFRTREDMEDYIMEWFDDTLDATFTLVRYAPVPF